MDTAYDTIQQESLPDADFVEPRHSMEASMETGQEGQVIQTTGAVSLTDEINDAVQTFSNTVWGAKIGGLWQNMRKQGEAALDVTKKDLSVAGERVATLSEQLRGSSIATQAQQIVSNTTNQVRGAMTGPGVNRSRELLLKRLEEAPESTSKMFKVLKQEAQVKLEDLDRGELSKYFNKVGMDVREFFRDAVTIDTSEDELIGRSSFWSDLINIQPADAETAPATGFRSDVLFDVPDEIKRQIYTTRLDAQLHALHTSQEPFLAADTNDAEFEEFSKTFSIESQTSAISADLDRYRELRNLMEKLVPEKIAYEEFWKRYYFLRDQINKEELRRKKLLSEAGDADENFDWDEDDDDDDNEKASGSGSGSISEKKQQQQERASNSTETLKPIDGVSDEAKVASSRPSSESSYDLVSAATSQSDLKAVAEAVEQKAKVNEEEDDWE
ncbi:hypothetical protein V1511DRAFT_492854 [Dipodascopsis uninucleata]